MDQADLVEYSSVMFRGLMVEFDPPLRAAQIPGGHEQLRLVLLSEVVRIYGLQRPWEHPEAAVEERISHIGVDSGRAERLRTALGEILPDHTITVG